MDAQLAAGDHDFWNGVYHLARHGVDPPDPRRAFPAGVSQACGAIADGLCRHLDRRSTVRSDFFWLDRDAHAPRHDWRDLPGRGGAAKMVSADSGSVVPSGSFSDSLG